jgi:hypothetical protein
MVAYISSEENLKNIETIRENNLKNAGILEGNPTANQVAIVWLSYNVHGNEASSTEASMKTLYTLLTQKQDWLKNTLIIIDPCINPDGRDRYVNWFNETSSTPYDSDQQASEHNEPWPGGRPNHYLFDLNRDWVWATQVESAARLKLYNTWMPKSMWIFTNRVSTTLIILLQQPNLFMKLSALGNATFKHKSEKITPNISMPKAGCILPVNALICFTPAMGTPIQPIWVPLE